MSGPAGLDALAALVRDCTASGVGRRALLLRTDVLPPQLARPHHLRLASAALDPLTLADRARKHELPNGRVAVSWRGESAALLRQSLDALEILLQNWPQDAPGMPELVGLYDLPKDGPALLHQAGVAVEPEGTADPAPPPRLALEASLAPLDTGALCLIEARLANADMARFARRKPVCRLGPRGMQLAWDRRFLSVAEIAETVAPGRSAQADPWLFRRLTRVLDRRMLALLSDPDELRFAGPFSLYLNVGSILSPEFLRFDTALPPALRGRAVLDLSPADVLSDPAAFAFARGFARAKGYRLCLHGVTAALLPMLNLPSLDLDYVRLRWSAELSRLDESALRPGTARWILDRAGPQAAVSWGERVGIGLFAGVEVAVTGS